MDKTEVELLLLKCLEETCNETFGHFSLEYMFNSTKPEFIISQLAKKLVDKEKELARLLF